MSQCGAANIFLVNAPRDDIGREHIGKQIVLPAEFEYDVFARLYV